MGGTTQEPGGRQRDRRVPDYDIAIIGAGMGGIYATKRLRDRGFSVHGLEAASDVGGVWFHNRYPGARVDIEPYYYCFFDPEIYREWVWTERYPAQAEILAYLSWVADRYDVRSHFEFSTRMTGAVWDPGGGRYEISTDHGTSFTARYLVMATGQLSTARPPNFAGLDDFAGEWLQTSQWPQDAVDLAGKRVAVVGTGSTGVQTATALAETVAELFVFQRTANFSVPAHNAPLDQDAYARYARDPQGLYARILEGASGAIMPTSVGPAASFAPQEQRRLLEERWAFGGHTMNMIFTDQGTNEAANAIVADFIRDKIRGIVKDPDVAAMLLPYDHPVGTRRLVVDTGYYEAFNRENVTLVDARHDPIERITSRGIKTRDSHYDVDVIIFALGFQAYTGALQNADVRNDKGESPIDRWARGPQTYLGLMTAGFPNLFVIAGPGSPSTLSNVSVSNIQHIQFVADLLTYMSARGLTRVEPSIAAQEAWTAHIADLAAPMLRLRVDNYMVHVNADDGSRVFMPYPGGVHAYAERCEAVARSGYAGFELSETL